MGNLEVYERILEFLLGVMFLAGGGIIAKNSLDAKNIFETALFGLLGVAAGLFLMVCGVCGPPN